MTEKVARRPNVTTVMAQAAVGYIAANFLLILARILFFNAYNYAYVLVLPMELILGVIAGVVVGPYIWVGFKLAGKTLNLGYRSIIAVVLTALAYLAIILILAVPFPLPEQTWVLGMILTQGIGMGLVTGSRLRLWHELVRKGEPVGTVLAIFANLTGVILRLIVPVLFMASYIQLIGILQSDPEEIHWHWGALRCAHFTAAVVMLFARIKTDVLLPLAVIVNAPVVAAMMTFPELWHAALGYLALWAVFLLTRWRQTPVELSFLKEEFRYYLID